MDYFRPVTLRCFVEIQSRPEPKQWSDKHIKVMIVVLARDKKKKRVKMTINSLGGTLVG